MKKGNSYEEIRRKIDRKLNQVIFKANKTRKVEAGKGRQLITRVRSVCLGERKKKFQCITNGLLNVKLKPTPILYQTAIICLNSTKTKLSLNKGWKNYNGLKACYPNREIVGPCNLE